MTLYLRLLMVLIKAFFCRKTDFFATSKLSFMVWPWDCDINIHLTNSRYLAMMDLGRVMWSAQIGMAAKMTKRRWFGVLQSCESTFLRPLKPFQRFELRTKILYWDDKYFYLSQEFYSQNKLHTASIVRGIILEKGRRKVPMAELFTLLDKNPAPLPEPDVIRAWRGLMENKKKAL